jgi:hypothetical protein
MASQDQIPEQGLKRNYLFSLHEQDIHKDEVALKAIAARLPMAFIERAVSSHSAEAGTKLLQMGLIDLETETIVPGTEVTLGRSRLVWATDEEGRPAAPAHKCRIFEPEAGFAPEDLQLAERLNKAQERAGLRL